jgi:hypothetical protein
LAKFHKRKRSIILKHFFLGILITLLKWNVMQRFFLWSFTFTFLILVERCAYA